jgi:hypothetical protein
LNFFSDSDKWKLLPFSWYFLIMSM